jgi:hypothetical protein
MVKESSFITGASSKLLDVDIKIQLKYSNPHIFK